MPAPKDLKDLYLEELQDLWSANDQMKPVVDRMASEASDSSLGDRLRGSAEGVAKHSSLLRDLVSAAGGDEGKEHCKAMEGIVSEAERHALDIDAQGAVKDVAMISHFQRMCHYGLAGFGTAKAYAQALGRDDEAARLDDALRHIHQSDDYMSEVATRSKNLEAR